MRCVIASLALCLAAIPATAGVPVVTDIAPVHSLVARVMAGAGEPALLIPPGASPHDMALRPSDAAALEAARVVFWVGPELEPWLEKPIAALAGDAAVAPLLRSAGTTLLPPRQGDGFAAHEPAAEGALHAAATGRAAATAGAATPAGGTAAQAGGAPSVEAPAGSGGGSPAGAALEQGATAPAGGTAAGAPSVGAPAGSGGGSAAGAAPAAGGFSPATASSGEPGGGTYPGGTGGDHHGEDHHGAAGTIDPHAWLDPRNAAAWMDRIAETLAAADPANAALYSANAAAGRAEMAALEGELAGRLAAPNALRFVVLHDALQYFEARFGVSASAAISPSDGAAPGPARLAAIRAQIRETGITCALREPQFRDDLIDAAFEGTTVRSVVVDDLGASLAPGPDLYRQLLSGIATAMLACTN